MSWMWWLPCKHFTKANQCTCCFVDMFSIHDKLINNMAMDERVATHILIYKSYCGLIVSCEVYGVSEPVSWSVRRYDGFSSPAILLSYSPLRQFRQRLKRKTTPTQEKNITWQTIYIYIYIYICAGKPRCAWKSVDCLIIWNQDVSRHASIQLFPLSFPAENVCSTEYKHYQNSDQPVASILMETL